MLSRNQLLFFSIVFAVAGTLAFAFLAGRLQPAPLLPSEISFEKGGMLVQVSGRPAGVSLREGSLSFILCSEGCVQVRATRAVGEELEARGALKKLSDGVRASAVGVVKAYGRSPYLDLLEPNSLEFFE